MSEVVKLEQPSWSDRIISGTIDGLLTARDSTADDLVYNTGITRPTLYRKMRLGRWTATEVKQVADAFHVPVSDLYDGRVTPGPRLPKSGSDERTVTDEYATILSLFPQAASA